MFNSEVNRHGQPLPELPPDRRTFTFGEVAALLGRSEEWVFDQCRLGQITVARWRQKTSIPKDEVVRLLQVLGEASQTYYTPRLAAPLLFVSEHWVRKRCHEGAIRFIQYGPDRQIRIPVSEVERLNAELEEELQQSRQTQQELNHK